MKKYYLFLILLSSFIGFAQFNPSAPWMKPINDTKKGLNKNKQTSINELKSTFDTYWESHNKNKKGSGFKPFMRWENHWSNKTNPQGFIITPEEMWSAFNQKKERQNNRLTTLVPNSNWVPVGPFTHTNTGSWSSGQGRVNVVYEDPSNPNIIYIGTPAGGIWKSTTNGTNWIPLSDNLPQIGVSGIAVSPTNSNIIYISTGDCDGSDTYSIGVMKSIDGGLSWSTTGLTFTNTNTFSGDILINPSDVNMLWVATSNGIYKSTNAGATWTNTRTGDFSQGRIRLKPNEPNTVYAVNQNKFYKSTDAGSTFTSTATGLPSSSGRLIMDVTPANANIVYILSSNSSGGFQGVYKSIDAGATFIRTANNSDVFESNQSWYDLAFAVSPTNADELYTGCLNLWRSTNGGTSFIKRNNWSSPSSPRYTHADIHHLRFFGNRLYCGSDGGVYVSTDNSASFTDLTATAQIGMIYKIAVSTQSASKMMTGHQDNGGHAYSDNQWKNYYGADGMDTAIDPTNSNKYYGFIQFGSNLYISNNAGNSSSGGISAPVAETGTNDDGGNWVTPLVMNSAGDLYAGYSNLYKLNNGVWERQNVEDLGIGDFRVVTIDPSNNNNIYISSSSELYKSTDKGVNFESIFNSPSTITSIDIHSTNSEIIYLTTQGTSGQTLKSIDGGTTFANISNGLPNIAKNVIVHQGQNSNNPLFVGTSLGVYYRDDTMSQWEPYDTNLPNVSISDLDINLEDKKITAATYGRGVWQSSIVVEVPLNDVKLTEILSPISTEISCTQNSVTPQIKIKNNGSNVINNVAINYAINTTNYSYDWNGVLNPDQYTTITLPEVTLGSGSYNLVVTSTILNDGISENNTVIKTFYINTPGILNQVNTFESSTDNLLAYDDSGLLSTWQRGICTGGVINSGTNNVYASNLSGNYEDNRKSFLVSGCYNLTQLTNPKISFKMAYDLEENWDVVYVQYSVNSGSVWYNLGEMGTNWYNSDRTELTTGNDCNNCPGGQWTGTNTTLTTYEYPLNQLGGFSNIMFRIVFHSDGGVTQLGVVVDDFLVEGTSLSTQQFDLNKIAIYPNPSKGVFNIGLGNAIPESIEVNDVSGKTIVLKNNFQNNSGDIPLDLSAILSGVYFVKIKTENQTVIKKIIKN